MHNYLSISGKNLIKILKTLGFEIIRINGSHYRLKHPDGMKTTVPVHQNIDLPKGLIRKIVIEDLEMELNDIFNKIRLKSY